MGRCKCVVKDETPRHKGWLQSASQPQQGQPAASADAVVPLEFKTGKPHNSHRAQVLLVACCCSVSNSPQTLQSG